MTTAQDSDKVVSLKHRPPLPPGNTPGTHSFLLEAESTQGEGLCQWKIPRTPSGIVPAAIRFVAQYLNHCVPRYIEDDNPEV
jgi:hypothetical protein